VVRIETEIEIFRQASAEHIKGYKRLERLNCVIAGILIGTGVGGWVALGMKPNDALALIFIGGSFGLGGVGVLHSRRHYEEYRNDVLKGVGSNDSPKR